MKKILFIILLCTVTVFAQNDSIQLPARMSYKDRQVRFMSDIRVIALLPNAVGDNFLAKGNSGDYGVGLKFGIFKIYNFTIGVGGELLSYKTTNPAYGGDTSTIGVNTGYLEGMYSMHLSKFVFSPRVSLGYSSYYFITDDERGEQDGLRLGAGAYADYYFTNWFALFLGAEYTRSYPRVETNAAYQDFFGKVEQLNFSAGVKFTIKD